MAILEEIVSFAEVYHAACNTIIKSFGQNKLIFHNKTTDNSLTIQAKDGFVTFYNVDDGDSKDATGTDKYSNYDLNTLCQHFSNHMLFVKSQVVGEAFQKSSAPVKAELIEKLNWPWLLNVEAFNPAYLAGHESISYPCFAVGKLYAVDENAVIAKLLPFRFKVWSPVVRLPSGDQIRLYKWTHADFWFEPKLLGLPDIDPEVVVKKDIFALSAVYSHLEMLSDQSKGANANA